MTNYEKYQLQWMIDHDVSLDNLIEEMYDYALCELDEDYRYSISPASTAIEQTYNAIINDTGFAGGQMFACEREWENEERNVTCN